MLVPVLHKEIIEGTEGLDIGQVAHFIGGSMAAP